MEQKINLRQQAKMALEDFVREREEKVILQDRAARERALNNMGEFIENLFGNVDMVIKLEPMSEMSSYTPYRAHAFIENIPIVGYGSHFIDAAYIPVEPCPICGDERSLPLDLGAYDKKKSALVTIGIYLSGDYENQLRHECDRETESWPNRIHAEAEDQMRLERRIGASQ
jgi:hypothetical protein